MKRKRQPIIAVGDLVWDVLAKPDHMLLPGGDTTGRIALAPGGSAANVAAWIARVGMPAGFVVPGAGGPRRWHVGELLGSAHPDA